MRPAPPDWRPAAAPLALAAPAAAQKRTILGPGAASIQAAINAAHSRYRTLAEGKNADYIPALAEVSSAFFGIAVAGSDGKVHEAGDSKELFSIQSISKVFTAALVMQESGDRKIEDSVGVDATGQVFNSITAVEQFRGKEMNPFVNPGRDRDRRQRQGLLARRGLGEDPPVPLRLRRPPARRQPAGLQVRRRHQPPQPRDQRSDVGL